MTKRKKHDVFDRLGLRLAALPSAQRVGIALFVFLSFAASSLIAVNVLSAKLADRLDPKKPSAEPAVLGFSDLVIKATGAAYSAFFDLSLSRINFISNYVTNRSAGDHEWEYTFWELWVPNDFDFDGARKKFVEKLAVLGPNVRTEAQQIDSKTLRLNVDIEGMNTHRVFLTRTAVEVEQEVEQTFAMADTEQLEQAQAATKRPRIAIIIDDIGYRDLLEREMLELDAALTFSVLPHSPYGQNFANRARMKGRDVMLHMPMEPKDPTKRPGQGGLFVTMADAEIRQIAAGDLDFIPGIVGVNNHMGSRFTSDPDKMKVVLEMVKNRNLYFIDSRTAGSSIAYETAKRLGIKSGVRNVFLDHEPEYSVILKQCDALLAFAKKHGAAIAIGHPHDNTLKALRAKLHEFKAAGVDIVAAGALVR